MLFFEPDYKKLKNAIYNYTQQHKEQLPILLMNTSTVEYLKKFLEPFSFNSEEITSIQMCGCHVAIADWMLLGEVELR